MHRDSHAVEPVTFHRVFAELSTIAEGRPRAAQALRRLITFDDRLPHEHGLAGLAHFDRELYARLDSSSDARLTEEPPTASGRVVEVSWNTLGRVYLRPLEEPPPTPRPLNLRRIGYLAAEDALFDEARAATAAEQARERTARERLDDLLADASRERRLAALLDGAIDAVRHVEAVCWYIDDQVYASMERVQTLVGGPSILLRLRDEPCIDRWTPAERLLVVALHALFLTGSSIRFEEFNGAALTACRLVARIRALGRAYADHGVDVDDEEPDLFALSAAVGRSARAAVGRPFLRYREVSGWTFRKIERCTKAPGPDVSARFSPQLAEFARRWIGRPFDGSPCAAEDLAREIVAATEAAPARDAADDSSTPVEQCIREIVASAVHVTSADYGMSSSIRCVGPLARAAAGQQLALILTLKPKDFFCCVTGRPGLTGVLASAERDIYRPVKSRMQFNRWHFICGNYPSCAIPRERHWFYPPMMPDLAEWADVWHPGHTRAGVRYSIRAPGPDTSLPPLGIGAGSFRGFYDVRVVRIAGAPFTLDDLFVTRQHCVWMGALWQQLVAAASIDIAGFEAPYEPDGSLEVAL